MPLVSEHSPSPPHTCRPLRGQVKADSDHLKESMDETTQEFKRKVGSELTAVRGKKRTMVTESARACSYYFS